MKILNHLKTCKCGCLFEYEENDILISDNDIETSYKWIEVSIYGDIIYLESDYTFQIQVNTKSDPYGIIKLEHPFVRCPTCKRMILV